MTNKNLTGKKADTASKKQIAEAVKKTRPNGDGKVPRTAQQSIPFQQMLFSRFLCSSPKLIVKLSDKLNMQKQTIEYGVFFCKQNSEIV